MMMISPTIRQENERMKQYSRDYSHSDQASSKNKHKALFLLRNKERIEYSSDRALSLQN